VQVADEAVELLETAWPEAALEMHELVRQIIFFDGDESDSASTIHTHGAVYLTTAPTMVNLPAIFEALLHESGHHAMTLKESFSRMLLNSEERTESPLRGAPRPVRGVLQGVFVLMRMVHGIERAIPLVGLGERGQLQHRVNFLRMRREVGFRSLERTAHFTDRGAQLFETMRQAGNTA
jgi:HEXXH motif-containing protein